MRYGYSNKGSGLWDDRKTVHKTKASTGHQKEFRPECRDVVLKGEVVTGEELTIRASKKGLKVRKCSKCFGWFDSW